LFDGGVVGFAEGAPGNVVGPAEGTLEGKREGNSVGQADGEPDGYDEGLGVGGAQVVRLISSNPKSFLSKQKWRK
jgi:hypothetical protein